MQNRAMPTVDAHFRNDMGENFTVIGLGTQGIIIEYGDGRVELVSQNRWENLSIEPANSAAH